MRLLRRPAQSLTGCVVACARRVVACNLVMEYTLSCAAVARGFSAYLATLVGQRPTFFIVEASFLQMDFFALGLIVVLSCILAYGTKARGSPIPPPPPPNVTCLPSGPQPQDCQMIQCCKAMHRKHCSWVHLHFKTSVEDSKGCRSTTRAGC